MTDQPARQPNRLVRWFHSHHLPAHLQDVVRTLHGTALVMDDLLPDGPEKTAGLRKLLEAKDCFVRARIEGGE